MMQNLRHSASAGPSGRPHEQQAMPLLRSRVPQSACSGSASVCSPSVAPLPQRHSSQLPSRRPTLLQAVMMEEVSAVKVPWHKKVLTGSEHWTDLIGRSELDEALLCKDSKFAVVDFYAGWCTGCKAAWPALSKVASAESLRESVTFYKVNIEAENVSQLIRDHNVRGIPTMLVFSPTGGLVASFPASFKKIEAVRRNLEIIAMNSHSQKYELDKETGHLSLV